MIALPVVHLLCQKCGKPLRRPSAYAHFGCHRCDLLHWDWVRSAELPEIPAEPRKPAPCYRPRWTADDLSDMDRRGEYVDDRGEIRWMRA